jgi:hypothetical protein
MGAIPLCQLVVFHYAAYIEELQGFFASYGLRYGSADDLPALAEQLRAPGPFASDFGLMLRSIFAREGRSLSRPEMLEVVTMAIAGCGLNDPPRLWMEPLNQLYAFISRVRSQPVSRSNSRQGNLIPFPLR